MSVEQEIPNRLERKRNQLNTIQRLVYEQLPTELNRVLSKGQVSSFVLDRGKESAVEIFISDFKKGWDNSTYMLYMREFDIRKYCDAYMMDLVKYFSEEELLVLDITDEELDDEMKFFTLESEDQKSGAILMLRDMQVEVKEDVYDECYYFLVSVK